MRNKVRRIDQNKKKGVQLLGKRKSFRIGEKTQKKNREGVGLPLSRKPQ